MSHLQLYKNIQKDRKIRFDDFEKEYNLLCQKYELYLSVGFEWRDNPSGQDIFIPLLKPVFYEDKKSDY